MQFFLLRFRYFNDNYQNFYDLAIALFYGFVGIYKDSARNIND